MAVLSVVFHVCCWLLLPEALEPLEPAGPQASAPVELALVEVPPAATAIEPATESTARASRAVAPARTGIARRSPPPTSERPPLAPPAEPMEELEAPPTPATTEGTASQPDLRPRSVARIAMAAREAATDAREAATEPARDDALAAQRGAELSAYLGAVARKAAPRPRELVLRRDPDGTCHYDGHSIDATILPDGGVRFESLPAHVVLSGLEPPPERPVTPEEMVPAPDRIEANVKIVPRAWDAEREWFLRESQALRAELADATRKRELELARARLQRGLEAIWCTSERPEPLKRAQLFERWDRTSPDEVGQLGRDTVIDFVRLNLPAGSEHAFPEEELASLNARRMQRERFDPYADSGPLDAGTR